MRKSRKSARKSMHLKPARESKKIKIRQKIHVNL
jgi:hypothetical protein